MGLHVRIFTLLALVFLPMHSDGYPNGKVEPACSTMMPSHGADAQSSFPPYSLSFSSVNYTGKLGFTVTLSKDPGGNDFKGFLIQARPPGENTPMGTFIVNGTDAQTLCSSSEFPDRAVSHTSSNMKSNVAVIWLPPKKASTDIQFRATVVQARTIFWTNVFSDVIPLAGKGLQLFAPSLGQLVLCSSVLICALFTI
ncbi:defense protein l(2)34Fc-like [Anomaloglossus baeobatrachus]|uniref:defense protein l(2)34Fc-like n=1 Tax=Anomaloglossus baeobatrachus TaxID=238106 RepID=UPI003F505AA8